MEKLGHYELLAPLTNKNAGYSMWGFGRKNNETYFIKQFVEQKYPFHDTISSPAHLEKKLRECERFEQKKVALYEAVNQYSDGNAVRVAEFFRLKSKYYVAMQKIDAIGMSLTEISKLTHKEISELCAIIAHSLASLHEGGIVHSDLKPDNILFTNTAAGFLTAKIIDFDSAFLETDPPGPGEPIVGDFHYFSPEACVKIWADEEGEPFDYLLTCKMDVFALGVLFHQYFTGKLPGFNTDENTYSGEASAKGETLVVSSDLPDAIRELLSRMLENDPDKRPTAKEVHAALLCFDQPDEKDPDEKDPDEKDPKKPGGGNHLGKKVDKYFHKLEDL